MRNSLLIALSFIVLMSVFLISAVLAFAGCPESLKTPHHTPYISKDAEGFDRCAGDDPLGPCFGRLVTVTNPTKASQVVEIECRPGLVTARSVIGPRRSVTFDLGYGNGFLDKGQCVITKCYRWKGEPVEP